MLFSESLKCFNQGDFNACIDPDSYLLKHSPRIEGEKTHIYFQKLKNWVCPLQIWKTRDIIPVALGFY